MNIHKGDNVIVKSGKERGVQAKVLSVFPDKGMILVEGVGMHQKRERAKREGAKGQTVSAPSPIPASRVMLFCTSCNKGVRAGMSFGDKKKKKMRICRLCKNNL